MRPAVLRLYFQPKPSVADLFAHRTICCNAGEKISSMKGYRRWLRDQAAYRRKALHGLKEEEAL